ncbi:glutathione S-transferase N-terminal domain-containing protein [Psychrobium sp. MM17-31]|uniref:glutathione S-transferase family protein n=1 Tax=Psychrobium sp. MM17-31 TaxID=2917758 RepID=UPI001EF55E80|nr:glutathione S-transferase N-terminal domain-containing protein [Psychrobium sp. MM17-31]MCG7532489.1 glutathione S-transferase N-terminal domain-containing protein [Psychrobium sp. MM17-31]
MILTVGTDSTWSLRAWICAQLADIKTEINVIDLSSADYKNEIAKVSDAGLVPVLSNGSLRMHDSLAIVEYFDELSQGKLYPAALNERALARSLCCEMHAGFMALRANCPFTLENVEPITDLTDAMRSDLARVESIFEGAKLPFMFDSPNAVDAFYAILAYRLSAYGIVLKGQAGDYQKSLLNWSLLKDAIGFAKSCKA